MKTNAPGGSSKFLFVNLPRLWALVLLLQPIFAQTTITVGVPSSGGNGIAFGDAIPEFQQVYSSSIFSGPVSITGITFTRTNVASSGSNTILSATYTFSLSTTSKSVGGLSNSNFASNLGSDNQLFSTDALSGTPASVFITGSSFYYDPSQGNLLLDITQANVGTGGGIFFDSMNGTATLFSRATGFSGTTGYGLVTTFTYSAVPEAASTSALMALLVGAAVFGFRRYRRSKKLG